MTYYRFDERWLEYAHTDEDGGLTLLNNGYGVHAYGVGSLLPLSPVTVGQNGEPQIEVLGIQVYNDGGVRSWEMDYASVGPPPEHPGRYVLIAVGKDTP